MRDQLFDRDYQNGRDALHGGIDRLIEGAARTFRAINAFHFAAPWKVNAKRNGERKGLV